jgi:hypothetical protein
MNVRAGMIAPENLGKGGWRSNILIINDFHVNEKAA